MALTQLGALLDLEHLGYSVAAAKPVAVEGILPFVEPELCALFDYKIFVDTDADERILNQRVRLIMKGLRSGLGRRFRFENAEANLEISCSLLDTLSATLVESVG